MLTFWEGGSFHFVCQGFSEPFIRTKHKKYDMKFKMAVLKDEDEEGELSRYQIAAKHKISTKLLRDLVKKKEAIKKEYQQGC